MSKPQFDETYYIGTIYGSYVGYAKNPETRHNAASGGAVSAITRYLLDMGIVSMVLASRLEIVSGKFIPEIVLAEKSSDLDDCKNSIYFSYHIGSGGSFRKIVDRIRNGGRVAVVGLHCHLKTLSYFLKRNNIPKDRCLMIGLFCSHAPDIKLLYGLFNRLKINLNSVSAYRAKTGVKGNDGRLHATSTVIHTDGTETIIPHIKFTTYRNCWFYAHNKCLTCSDQFAENADISCGDAWYKEIQKEPCKYTTILARTAEANQIVLNMAEEDILFLGTVDPKTVIHSQSKVTAIAKHSRSARTKLAGLFGIHLPESRGSSRIIDYIHSFFLLLNVKWSRSEKMSKIIFKIPYPLMFSYVIFLKVLEKLLLLKVLRGNGVGDIINSSKK